MEIYGRREGRKERRHGGKEGRETGPFDSLHDLFMS